MADVLADATLAAYVRGAGRVAGEIPHERSPAVVGSTPPDPAPWPGMKTWLPVVDEAARSLADKQIVLDLGSLAGKAREQAFSVASLNTEDAIGKVRDALVEAVEAGHDFDVFADHVGEAIGTSALGVGQLQNVYRTGMAQAYASGQEAIYSHPVVKDLFPYVETMPVRDSRLTDLCAVISKSGLQGTGIFLASDPTWIRFRPPRHWQCRCGTRRLTVAQAAARGIRHAQEWLHTGVEPPPEYVPYPDVELPKGWVSSGDGFQLSFCNACHTAERALMSLGTFDEEGAILLSWVPFTTKTGKAAYWDANPKRKLYGKAYAAWAAKQGQPGAVGQQTEAKPKATGAKQPGAKPPNAPSKGEAAGKPAPAAGAQPDNPANPKLAQPAAKVSADLAKIAEQAKQDLADNGHPINRLGKEMREVSVGAGMPKVKTIAGPHLSAKDHQAMGRFHLRLSKGLAINGNPNLANAQSLAAQSHFRAAKVKDEEDKSRVAALHTLVDKHLDEATHLDTTTRTNYGESFKRVLGRMSPKAIERMHAGVKGFSFHANPKQLTSDLAAAKGEKFKALVGNGTAAGVYSNDTGSVALDGGGRGVRGNKLHVTDEHHGRDHVYAHELTHALDGGHFGTKISASKNWEHAWRDEIAGAGEISDYAKHNPSEGFAEFGRMVFSQGRSAAEIRKAFPRCAAVWDQHGLLHDPPQETARPGPPKKMPTVFSKPISDYTMTGDLSLPKRAWDKAKKLLQALHA